MSSTGGVAPGAPGVPVVNSTWGTVMVEVRVEVRVSLTVTIWEIVMVVHGTVTVAVAVAVTVGPNVIVVGIAVMMPGFSGICAAQMPVR